MNPLADNPLKTRADFARSVVQLWEPTKPYFSEGKARVNFGLPAAHFPMVAAELEGFARPLFGLAPLAAGDLPFDDWDMIREGYANGTDPEHPEFWGNYDGVDQRQVESAAIGFGLIFAKEQIWDPLTDKQKENVANWLKFCQTRPVANNNWHFFHVLGSLGLESVGVEHDLSVRENALDTLESFYIGEGWYADGEARRFDHYIPFAMHFYGLIYSKIAKGDEERCDRFRDRARQFAQEFKHWFDEDGASLAFGRSMTYRFAQASFWAGLAFADVEALPWGEIRGLWARNMRWWGERDYFDRDGIMPVGYAYPNLHMCEIYNSPGSPYWAMKSFLPLALPETHPFWQADEIEKQESDDLLHSDVAGMIGFRAGRNRVMLSSCNEMRMPLRGAAEKYAKFAYSTAFGFSMDPDRLGFTVNPFDNMLALSRDSRSFFTRSEFDESLIGPDFLWSKWLPDDDIEVETWLIARAPWHIRAHKITTARPLVATEGGFAIERTDASSMEGGVNGRVSEAVTEHAASYAVDMSPEARTPMTRWRTHPNSSLYFPQTHVPHLVAELAPGTTWLIGAYAATPDPEQGPQWLENVPDAPSIEWLEQARDSASDIKGRKFRERQVKLI
ncbi:DUF2264 domain-containing protein [Qingshengfaniella alkalisoli]|uniref:DUF2264 domain-containing protein n=1 Tax=Qingshengfaniella alkalisoli TaxID=2599296 RepID=A0A5B8IXB3_9RHOB|nr:DUF2264 domain-containing protein [Qingshengfaniella alkalisoli]QDY69218.1 DUF2264 domain-containing protein [Qingshengfaniella alkalisoli]